jgi:hypothetical protein
MDSIAAAPSAAHFVAFATTASPTAGDAKSPTTFARSHRATHSESTPQRTVCGVDSLLHPIRGRHAHDVRPSNAVALARALRHSMFRAVKNLRIADSAVLLLNFREVRDFHFRSTSAAM